MNRYERYLAESREHHERRMRSYYMQHTKAQLADALISENRSAAHHLDIYIGARRAAIAAWWSAWCSAWAAIGCRYASERQAGLACERLIDRVYAEGRAHTAERERDEAREAIAVALRYLDTATDVDTEQAEANRHAAYAQTELGRYMEHGYRVKPQRPADDLDLDLLRKLDEAEGRAEAAACDRDEYRRLWQQEYNERKLYESIASIKPPDLVRRITLLRSWSDAWHQSARRWRERALSAERERDEAWKRAERAESALVSIAWTYEGSQPARDAQEAVTASAREDSAPAHRGEGEGGGG